MKLGKAGLLALGLTTVITFTGITYTGTDVLNETRQHVEELRNAIIRLADEGAQKVGNANGVIAKKNEVIKALEGEITKGNEEIKRLEGEVTKANDEAGKLNEEVKVTTDKYKDTKIIPTLKDDCGNDEYKVSGKKLGVTIVQNADTSKTRTIRITNPNSYDVTIDVKSSNGATEGLTGEYTVKAGDVIYLVKSTNGEMAVVSYKVPGTNEVEKTTK